MSDKIRDNNIEKLMQLSCRIIDIFPERVPERMAGRYSEAEQYYLSPPRLEMIRRKYAEIIIKLGCYRDIFVSTDHGETFAELPSPEKTEDIITACTGAKTLYFSVSGDESLIVMDGCDTYMTVYASDEALIGLFGKLASSAGLFIWKA